MMDLKERIKELEMRLIEKDAVISEKNHMMKDIFHRVKNDYNVISSILNLESYDIHESAVSVLEDCISRIYTMSQMNEMLYKAISVGHIKAEDYIKTICETRYTTFNKKGLNVERKYDFDDITLESKTATYCGLFANEVFANAMKYAFNRKTGSETESDVMSNLVNVSLKKIDDNILRFSIEDNGVGLPEGFDTSESNSLGTKLIGIFAKSLGELSITSSPKTGTSYVIDFKYSK
jgi:two-component sensor histidine kinase